MKALLPPLPQPENQPDFAAGQDGPAEAHPPARSDSAIAARNLSNRPPRQPGRSWSGPRGKIATLTKYGMAMTTTPEDKERAGCR